MEYAIGLMSGTSLDGIDVALVEIKPDDLTFYRLHDFISVPLTLEMKQSIKEALAPETSDVRQLCSLNFELGYLFADAVKTLCDKHGLATASLRFIASHGQTVYHLPDTLPGLIPSTLQIGESSVIAEMTGTMVVSDFRYRDMAANGQGAPIVPFSEYILYRTENTQRILQNIGGISNATIIPAGASLEQVLAFDTGPGNMIIDELCRHFYQTEYDADGAYAAAGQVNQALLATFMSHPFIQKVGPKTTGREEFGQQYVEELLQTFPNVSANDWLHTATLFTAKAISTSLAPLIEGQCELIVGGGGSYNATLIAMLQAELPNVKVMTQEDLGHSSEAKEAMAMVVLGHHTLHRLPSNVPSATGASHPVILGKVTY